MSEEQQHQYDELRAAMYRLFKDAGYENIDLLRCIDALEREQEYQQKLQQLTQENLRLKEQVKRWRTASVLKEGSMSSRLRDALRE